MSGSVNSVFIVGHLGADPEVRQTANGTSVANLRIATSERIKGEDVTEWHRVTAWGQTADACGQYLAKGRLVCVEGRIQTRKWTDNDGTIKYSTEIQANRVTFLGGGDKQGQQTDRQEHRGGGYQDRQPTGGSGATDEDVPF